MACVVRRMRSLVFVIGIGIDGGGDGCGDGAEVVLVGGVGVDATIWYGLLLLLMLLLPRR